MNDPFSVVVSLPDGMDLFDPDPDETAKRDVRLVAEWDTDTKGVVGWSAGGWDALQLAVTHADLPRLAIVSLPFPDDMPSDFDPAAIQAKTLLVYGSADPLTGNRHGTHWQKTLPNARLEMRPGGGHDLLVPAWKRILAFLAPRRTAS
ncbi:MAG: dienelactone hydrolase family protein [Acidimicrobiia bacterium]